MLATGSRLHGKRVTVCVAAGEGPARGAWVAGRKVGGAVKRNRARRLLREAWWAAGPRVLAGHDVVLVARGGIRGARAAEVVEEVETVLQGAGLMGR